MWLWVGRRCVATQVVAGLGGVAKGELWLTGYRPLAIELEATRLYQYVHVASPHVHVFALLLRARYPVNSSCQGAVGRERCDNEA